MHSKGFCSWLLCRQDGPRNFCNRFLLRKYLGDVFRELALQKESKVLEGHLMGDHVHMLVSFPPKYAVSQVVGYIKGKSAIHIARTYDEETIRKYIKRQEEADKRIDQLKLF